MVITVFTMTFQFFVEQGHRRRNSKLEDTRIVEILGDPKLTIRIFLILAVNGRQVIYQAKTASDFT